MKGITPKQYIELCLKWNEVKFETEYKFSDKRKFRFDYAIPEHKIAIEYEGVYQNHTGKSRHTTVTGYSRDCEKYNLAVIEGWRVLRYTAKNVQNLDSDIKKLLFT